MSLWKSYAELLPDVFQKYLLHTAGKEE